jgi:purine-nucleoside phosphorylase
MGTPSLSIVVEELLRLGARRLIRVGTCGGIGPGIRTGDLVIATAATPNDGATRTYLGDEPYAPTADFELTRSLVDAAVQRGIRPHVGQICTIDVFYNPDAGFVPRMRARGILALEMETSALYYLAARAFAAGDDVRAATILTVSDVLSEETTSEQSYLPLEELERATERMFDLGLEAAIAAS